MLPALYKDALDRKATESEDYRGRDQIFAQKLRTSLFQQLAAETPFIQVVDGFIKYQMNVVEKASIAHSGSQPTKISEADSPPEAILVPTPHSNAKISAKARNKLVEARADLLSSCGKYAMTIGEKMLQKMADLKRARKHCSVDAKFDIEDAKAREEVWRYDIEDRLAELETDFRKLLGNVFEESSLRPRRYALKADIEDVEQVRRGHAKKSKKDVEQVLPVTVAAVAFDEQGEAVQTEGKNARKEVFKRLGIHDEGEKVLYRPPCPASLPPSETTPVKKQEPDESQLFGSALMVIEPAETRPGVVDCVDDEPLNQPTIAKLVSLNPPQAVICVQVGTDEEPKSKDVTVHCCDLHPVAKTLPDGPATSKSCGLQLTSFDYDQMETQLLQELSTMAITLAHMSSMAGIAQLEVMMEAEEKGTGKLPTLPFKTKTRACRTFKIGELFLCPFGGELSQLIPDGHEKALAIKEMPKILDATLPYQGNVSARCLNKQRRDEGAPIPKRSFVVGSPLLQGKGRKSREECYQNLAPYWAIPQTSRGDHNMVLETMSFELPGLKASDSKFPCLKGAKFTVEIKIMRNIKVITKDEELLLAWQKH